MLGSGWARRARARLVLVAAGAALVAAAGSPAARALDGPVVTSPDSWWTASRYHVAGVSVVGDSLTRNGFVPISDELRLTGRPLDLNAQGGRNLEQAVPWILDLKKRGRLGGTVIIALGTNDVFADYATLNRRVKAVMEATYPRRVVWLVGYRSTEPLGSARVELIAAQWDRALPRLRTVRWGDVIRRNPGLLIADHIHLTTQGSLVYASTMARSLALYSPYFPRQA